MATGYHPGASDAFFYSSQQTEYYQTRAQFAHSAVAAADAGGAEAVTSYSGG